MIVMAVDPGLRECGYALIDTDRREADALLDHGLVRTASGAIPGRIAKIMKALKPCIRQAQRVVMEDTHARAHSGDERRDRGMARGAMQASMVIGAVTAYAQEHDVEVVMVAASSAKKALTGRGKATKAQMQATARKRFGAVLSEHEADAVGIALAGHHHNVCKPIGRTIDAGGRAKPAKSTKRAPGASCARRGVSERDERTARAIEALPEALQRAAERGMR